MISLPSTRPSDDRAGVTPLFWGIAIPYMLGALIICTGLVVGGTFGFVVAYGTLLLLIAGVVVGILAFIHTDSDDD